MRGFYQNTIALPESIGTIVSGAVGEGEARKVRDIKVFWISPSPCPVPAGEGSTENTGSKSSRRRCCPGRVPGPGDHTLRHDHLSAYTACPNANGQRHFLDQVRGRGSTCAQLLHSGHPG